MEENTKFYEFYEKTRAWVNTFNEYDSEMIKRLNCDDTFEELGSEYGYDIEKYDTYMPVWGYMWQYKGESPYSEEEFAKMLLENGFRVYKDDTLGIFFGIQGYGYPFVNVHWIPLYKDFFKIVEETEEIPVKYGVPDWAADKVETTN